MLYIKSYVYVCILKVLFSALLSCSMPWITAEVTQCACWNTNQTDALHGHHIPMYVCKLCNHSSGSLKRFSEHFSVHRNVVNFDFPCGVPGCNRTFRNYSSFKTHVHRDHQPFSRKKDAQFFCVSTWNCPLCAVKCEEIHDILSHLRVHIKHGVEIRCPFANCKKRFSVRSSFASHISRVHNKLDQIQLDSTSSETGTVLTESAQENNQEFPGRLHSSDEESVTDDEVDVSADSFKHSLSLFYLKTFANVMLAKGIMYL